MEIQIDQFKQDTLLNRAAPIAQELRVQSFDFLSQAECERLCKSILGLSRMWFQRKPPKLLFTLGAAVYQDVQAHDFDFYQKKSSETNSFLQASISWFYKKLLEKLSTLLDAPVRYHPKLALPGFHVMLADEEFLGAFADIHIDSQFDLIDESKCQLKKPASQNSKNTLSITIAIEKPKSGAGLNYWDLDKQTADKMSSKEITETLALKNMNYAEYQLGEIMLHSGLVFHQIAAWKSMEQNDRRITMQAHGIKCGEEWIIYW